MPIHDWTRVDAGIFHDFHGAWIQAIKRALNGKLPPDYYALGEQIAGGLGPDVLTLQGPKDDTPRNGASHSSNGGSSTVALATRAPNTRVRIQSEADQYARKAKAVVIRHVSDHRVVAVIEIVSPGNKSTRAAFGSFVRKAVELLDAGVHLLILDLFPPGPRDPQGVHKAIWEEVDDTDFTLPSDLPLTLAAYRVGLSREAFVEPTAVGSILPEMPVFLEPDIYIPLELEPTYLSAWESVPRYWREIISSEKGAC